LHLNMIFSIFMNTLFKKIIINVIKLSMCWEKCYIVVIHKDLSEWVKTQALAQATSSTVTHFLWKNIITQHKLFNKFICNDESENKMWIKDLTDLYKIDYIMMSAYNSDVNSMIKHRHKFLINELTKMTNEVLKKWTDLLSLIFWVNQITICKNIDKILYELLYEYSCVLLIKACISTWNIIVWHKVKT